MPSKTQAKQPNKQPNKQPKEQPNKQPKERTGSPTIKKCAWCDYGTALDTALDTTSKFCCGTCQQEYENWIL